MSCPKFRPSCKCECMKRRVYIRDTVHNRFHGIGWICPVCFAFHTDIAEAERKNAMFPEKVPVPSQNFILELLYPVLEDDDP